MPPNFSVNLIHALGPNPNGPIHSVLTPWGLSSTQFNLSEYIVKARGELLFTMLGPSTLQTRNMQVYAIAFICGYDKLIMWFCVSDWIQYTRSLG